MTAAAKLHNLPQPVSEPIRQLMGTVTTAEPGSWTVRTDEGVHQAGRAVSCLIEPRQGDVVLMTVLADDQALVLAVLTREDDDATLSVAGDLRIRPGGRVSLASAEGVSIASSKDVSLAAASVDINALHGTVGLQQLHYVGRFVQTEIDKTKLFGSSLDRVFDRITEKVNRAYRTVKELDHLIAERIDYRADKMMRLHGKHTLLTARELVKLDGEQIHMG